MMYTSQDVQMLYEDIRASIARAAQLPDSEGGTFIFLTLLSCADLVDNILNGEGAAL